MDLGMKRSTRQELKLNQKQTEMLYGHLLGLYEKALFPDWSSANFLKAAKFLGFNYMEISVIESDWCIEGLYFNKKQCMDLLMLYRKFEIPLQSLCLGVNRCFPYGSGSVFFVKCFRKLELLNYIGSCVLEMWNDPGINSMQAIYNAIKFISEQYSQLKDFASLIFKLEMEFSKTNP